jgi:hypothetical protein
MATCIVSRAMQLDGAAALSGILLAGRDRGRQQLVTVRLAGDDVADYFSVGGHFDVWMGDDIGQGVITRRLFV